MFLDDDNLPFMLCTLFYIEIYVRYIQNFNFTSINVQHYFRNFPININISTFSIVYYVQFKYCASE